MNKHGWHVNCPICLAKGVEHRYFGSHTDLDDRHDECMRGFFTDHPCGRKAVTRERGWRGCELHPNPSPGCEDNWRGGRKGRQAGKARKKTKE